MKLKRLLENRAALIARELMADEYRLPPPPPQNITITAPELATIISALKRAIAWTEVEELQEAHDLRALRAALIKRAKEAR